MKKLILILSTLVLVICFIDSHTLQKERKCTEPREIPDFLTQEECRAVIAAARRAGLERSEVSGERSVSKARTSRQVFLGHTVPAADAVVSKVESLLGVSRAKFEELQVVRYTKGQKYEAHYDSDDDTPAEEIRSDTVLVYLNDVNRGGHTRFPKAGVSVKPQRGKAVHWKNTDSHGKVLPCAYHAAAPVVRGVKWVCTVWFRPG